MSTGISRESLERDGWTQATAEEAKEWVLNGTIAGMRARLVAGLGLWFKADT